MISIRFAREREKVNIWRIETRFGLDQEIRLKKIREAKKKFQKEIKKRRRVSVEAEKNLSSTLLLPAVSPGTQIEETAREGSWANFRKRKEMGAKKLIIKGKIKRKLKENDWKNGGQAQENIYIKKNCLYNIIYNKMLINYIKILKNINKLNLKFIKNTRGRIEPLINYKD